MSLFGGGTHILGASQTYRSQTAVLSFPSKAFTLFGEELSFRREMIYLMVEISCPYESLIDDCNDAMRLPICSWLYRCG